MLTEISKSQFKAKALELFRTVESSGESIIVTDHGQPAVEVRPYHPENQSPLEQLKGCITHYQDPTEPVEAESWEVLS